MREGEKVGTGAKMQFSANGNPTRNQLIAEKMNRSPLLHFPPSPFLFVACILLFCTGCGGPSYTKAQFDRIKLGMSVSDVEEILGKGKVIDPGEVESLVKKSLEPAQNPAGEDSPKIEIDFSELRGIRWGNEKKNISVVFRNERVFRAFSQGL
jgi:hypothetical protein